MKNGLSSCTFCAFRAAKNDALGALRVDNVEAAADLHAALDFDEVTEMVHKKRHRAVREEGAGVAEGDEDAAICEQVLHDLEKNRKAAAEGGDVVGDDSVSGLDWVQKVLETVRLDFTGEVVLDPGVVADVVFVAPCLEGLAGLLERGGVGVELKVEVVHGGIRTYPSGQGRVGKKGLLVYSIQVNIKVLMIVIRTISSRLSIISPIRC